MKDIKNEYIKTIEGKDFMLPQIDKDGKQVVVDGVPKMVKGTLRDFIKVLVFNLSGVMVDPQLRKSTLSMPDSKEAKRLFEQMAKGTNKAILSIEDAEYDWLMEKVETYGPQVYGIHAIMVKEALEVK